MISPELVLNSDSTLTDLKPENLLFRSKEEDADLLVGIVSKLR